jgi:HSP20 family protein
MPLFDWTRDPWGGLRTMQRELSRLLQLGRDESEIIGGSEFPPVSVFDSPDSCLVLAEVPGIPLDSLDLSITDRTLVIKGSKLENGAKPEQYHRRERGAGTFSRTIVLPDPVRAAEVKATISRGILRVELPKSEAARPHKIGVKMG